MRKIKFISWGITSFIFVFAICVFAFAQEKNQADSQKPAATQTEPAKEQKQEAAIVEQKAVTAEAVQKPQPEIVVVGPEQAQVVQQEEPDLSPEVDLARSENVTFDFKEADIHNVIKIISYKSGMNIVTTPEVMGTVTMRLVDVAWELALDVVLKTYGYGYQRQGNVILVTRLENVAKIQAEEVLQTEIFELRFIDASDAQKVIQPMLSRRGSISILYTRGQKGWKYSTFEIAAAGGDGTKTVSAGALEREAGDETKLSQLSKTLIITDNPSSLDKIRNIILPQIDIKPQQVLIEARIMEVNSNKLRDLGVDWGLGSTGAEAATAKGLKDNAVTVATNSAGDTTAQLAGNAPVSQFKPGVFTSDFAGINGGFPYNMGAQFLFQKLTGWKFEAIVHALEDDVDTNILSAPRILTLDNQEASIMVGYYTPVFKTEQSTNNNSTTSSTITQTLSFYQPIGIKLFVVPQVNQDGYINMIIHPSVTSSTSSVSAQMIASGVTTPVATPYPVIDVRETQTQILLKDGETVVIGGLLKDQAGKDSQGIPFIKDIPLLGGLFRRDTYSKKKADLLIFITARIINEGEYSSEEIAKLQSNLGKDAKQIAAANRKKKAVAKNNIPVNNTPPPEKPQQAASKK